MVLEKFLDKTIEYFFYLLFFLVPLVLSPWNFELFEFNKMMLVYFLTAGIGGCWLAKMILQGKLEIRRTPLDLPILLFLLSQILSTIFSIEPHTSFYGYYSRFHGGLLSTICYLVLFYAFVTNFKKEKVKNFIYALLLSAFLVASYGILERLGIDKHAWVQDVQNRVFSTLGQPNWLAAWLDVLICLPIAFLLATHFSKNNILNLRSDVKYDKVPLLFPIIWAVLFTIFYLTILFTGSRSGFFGFLAAVVSFLTLLAWVQREAFWKKILFSLFAASFALFAFLFAWKGPEVSFVAPITLFSLFALLGTYKLVFKKGLGSSGILETLGILDLFLGIVILGALVFGTPITPPLSRIFKPKPPTADSSIISNKPEVDKDLISTTSDIRKVVWQGAFDICRHYPLFGSGVETYGYSYYNFRPVEHNLLSEWDFLYNKAHNEYLNYLACTGIVGLGAYLFLIGSFLWWNLLQVKSQKLKVKSYLHFALLSGYVSILVTNFFGFSVVPVALLFFLLPAFSFVLLEEKSASLSFSFRLPLKIRQFFALLVGLFLFYLWFLLVNSWWADFYFAKGKNLASGGYLLEAFKNLEKSVSLVENEPLFHDKLSEIAASLAWAYHQNDPTASGQLVEELTSLSLKESGQTLKKNAVHLNFYKTQTKVFLLLSEIKEEYKIKALETLEKAGKLAPTDAKIFYNLGLLYAQVGQNKKAMENLEKAVSLKSNYRTARFKLAQFYEETNQKEKAREQLEYILIKISSKDEETRKKLEDLKKL